MARSSLPCWEMPTPTDGTPTSSAASGPANSVVSLTTTSGPHALAGGEHAGKGGAGVDAREDVAHHAPDGRDLGAHGPDLGEDRVALPGGRVVEGPQRQALCPDHRGRLTWSGDEDVGARTLEGTGEGDQRAEVTGPGLGRHENAHERPDADGQVGFP